MIRNLRKTATRRQWAANYNRPKPGSVRIASTEMFTSHEEADCYIRVVECYEARLDQMSDWDYEREGGYSETEFINIWEQVTGDYNPREVVDVVNFVYIGEERDGHPDLPDEYRVERPPMMAREDITREGVITEEATEWYERNMKFATRVFIEAGLFNDAFRESAIGYIETKTDDDANAVDETRAAARLRDTFGEETPMHKHEVDTLALSAFQGLSAKIEAAAALARIDGRLVA